MKITRKERTILLEWTGLESNILVKNEEEIYMVLGKENMVELFHDEEIIGFIIGSYKYNVSIKMDSSTRTISREFKKGVKGILELKKMV